VVIHGEVPSVSIADGWEAASKLKIGSDKRASVREHWGTVTAMAGHEISVAMPTCRD